MREKRDPTEKFGIITRLVAEEGYAWVRADGGAEGDSSSDYFAHARAFKGDAFDDRERIYEGARVRFIATDSPKGPRALGVQALEGAEIDGNRAVPEIVGEAGEEEIDG